MVSEATVQAQAEQLKDYRELLSEWTQVLCGDNEKQWRLFLYFYYFCRMSWTTYSMHNETIAIKYLDVTEMSKTLAKKNVKVSALNLGSLLLLCVFVCSRDSCSAGQ